MANELAVLETQLQPLVPRFTQVLAGRMPPERLMRTVLVSAEKTPKLLDCTRQSLFNAAMSSAVLALEVDGVTGQAFLIPYGTNAQLVVGYKGMNTLGARSGYSIGAGTVREGDEEWDYREGSDGFVRHKRKLGNDGRIIAFWSVAESKTLKPLISILDIGEVLAIKAKSPGARKSDSPWNDPVIGFAAMGQKSARRRLSRSMPLNTGTQDFHLAARMEEAFDEQAKSAWIREDRTLMVDGTASPIATREPSETPAMGDITGPKPDRELERARDVLDAAAEGGTASLAAGWRYLNSQSPRMARELEKYKDEVLKPKAAKADTGA